MGVEDVNEPPKKKLKQAQLSFCNQSIKINKHKSNELVGVRKQQPLKSVINKSVVANAEKENIIDIVSDDDGESDENKMEISPLNIEIPVNAELETKTDLKIKTGDAEEISNSTEVSADTDLMEVCEEEKQPDVKDDIDEANEADSKNVENSEKVEDLSDKQLIICSSSEDEKNDANISEINSSQLVSPTTSHSTSTKSLKRKITPKSLEKRKQRESLKQEKILQKEKEKEEKLKIKLEKEEQKRKEREEKEKKKLAEIKQREEEKRLKDEEKKRKEEAKEEEKRRKEEAKEEEKRKKEEAKLIEQRKEDQAKKAFTNFFILKKSKTDNNNVEEINPKFMPFEIKADMRVAAEVRRTISDGDKEKLDSYFSDNVPVDNLYLSELKTKSHLPLKSESTWPLSEEQHDVIIIESVVDDNIDNGVAENEMEKTKRKHKKAKLLQFHENRRPAYWGTWRKKSCRISSRRPFEKEECLNYDVDSDSEWEDEGEGEDIGNEGDSDKELSDDDTADEKDENGYILDNTFVPHGYLSDEEIHPDEENFDPEDQKLRLKVLKKEFEEEMKSKTERLKPRLLGCVWISNDTSAVSKGSLYEVLMKYRGVWDETNGPIKVIGPDLDESPSVGPAVKSKPWPPEVMEQLVKFVHGNHSSFLIMVQEFRNLVEKENYPLLSKRAISIKIKEIASKQFDEQGKYLWCVNNELSTEYGLPPFNNTNTNTEKVKENLKQPTIKTASASTLALKSGSSVVQRQQNVNTSALPKKRATLITLPSTPVNEKNRNPIEKVHQDTPRPLHSFFKTVNARRVPPPQKTFQKSNDDADDKGDDNVILVD